LSATELYSPLNVLFRVVWTGSRHLLGVPQLAVCNQNTVGEMAIFNLYARNTLRK